MLKPPRLRAGSRVALVAPAGPVAAERIAAALHQCEALGVEAKLGRSAHLRIGYLAGTDAARLADLKWALESEQIDAVWALRGGYGTMRLLPSLDLAATAARPRAFIGFSDNTALHLTFARAGIVSFHAPHAGSTMPALTEQCFRRVLFEAEPAGTLPAGTEETARALVGGVAEAPLIGGNLALLAACCGTPCAPTARGRILVIEDVGEALYRVDRMLTQLLLSGALDGVKGVALGRFTGAEPEPEPHQPTLDELFVERLEPLGVPVLAGLPFGHVDENWSLPFGVSARLDADAGTLTILENAVT